MTFVISLQWANPYTEPPDGQPRVIRWGRISREAPMHDRRRLEALVLGDSVPGDGWGLYYTFVADEPKTFARPEAMQAQRVRNLRRRMEAKFPLFAETFIQETIEARPHQYSLEGCEADREAKGAAEKGYAERQLAAYTPEKEVRLPDEGKGAAHA